MSSEMSMFKKMKDKITDEVNSATNKLQNMQLIDQLASSIGPQTGKNDTIPHQILPGPIERDTKSSSLALNHGQFSLVDDSPNDEYEVGDELNLEISPQHQLFNENSIKRLKPTNFNQSNPDGNPSSSQTQDILTARDRNNSFYNMDKTVINIQELSSDLDDELDPRDEIEIDLLFDKEVPSIRSSHDIPSYKTKYRQVVHLVRRLNAERQTEKNELKMQIQGLNNKLVALKSELTNAKQHSDAESLLSISTNMSETERAGSPQLTSKSIRKIRDLEKLIAKCKESLKLKNSQLKILKDSLSEVENFKETFNGLKSELEDLRNAHEFWTVSIAEHKRVMHQEIESKNSEIERHKTEINDLLVRLKDSNNKSNQLKSSIQNLESKLVSTSAAHQKERESLIREMNQAKNIAIKQVQKEYDLNLERVKLDLEKSIEALKSEILSKDEHIMRSVEQQQGLIETNSTLKVELENTKKKLEESIDACNQLNSIHDNCPKQTLESRDNKQTDSGTLSQLELQSEEMIRTVDKLEKRIDNLATQLDNSSKASSVEIKPCEECHNRGKQLAEASERYEQSLFELNTKLDLMATANSDQEKALEALKRERDSLLESLKAQKSESEEVAKRNEALARMICDNESDMQNQQEQLDQLRVIKQDHDNLKRENSIKETSLNRLKLELDERTSDIKQARDEIESLIKKSSELSDKLKSSNEIIREAEGEKETFKAKSALELKKKIEVEQQLIVGILAAIKNLETPNTSPGSDKVLNQIRDNSKPDGDSSTSDPVSLIEELSSKAQDRSNSCLTATQRLQAVLLENSVMAQELERLKEELNTINNEKAKEALCSMEELERLRTENQALIHDQKAYDDQIASFEEEVESLTQQIATRSNATVSDACTETETSQVTNSRQPEEAKEDPQKVEIDRSKSMLAIDEQQGMSRSENSMYVPDTTEFEYLRNIGELSSQSTLDAQAVSSYSLTPNISPQQSTNLCLVKNH